MIIANYGGGVNSVAMLILLRDQGLRPDWVVMADPGHEWPETHAYRDAAVRPWLARQGFPDIVLVTRQDELRHRAGGLNFETLGGLCERTSSLPSIAYGSKKCSLNYKRAPVLWWMERQAAARAEWAAGRKITKCIGYDADEDRRVRPDFGDPVENKRYVPSYPLHAAGIDRDGCVALIVREGLAAPHKSACVWCPSNTLAEWRDLRDRHPSLFAEAVAMSRRAEATVQSPDVAGLMRCNPNGKRQLHVWVDGGYGEVKGRAMDDEVPCECKT